ncbi:hypothetical protein MSG28_015959 [Choristoneura fumiferana]|uniref:Uncharacterized protein n=1 Tax=Choristoneura fumiferana TaxID=7141 RepID=A0ACC0K5B5_CHOFU|nr:hypothetical protein MSG28_015959 [Choristoneura fumiferana]
MERWAGKTAVVTGASAGIGAAACVRLAAAGLRVAGLARRPQLVEAQVKGTGSIVARACDVSQPDEVAAAFAWVDAQLGGVDILVVVYNTY